jgi:S-sulfo-L-cysteine synthase (O-acetyl-L-serine-dependent)
MEQFLEILQKNHSVKSVLPSQQKVELFLDGLMSILFPTYSNKVYSTKEKLEEAIALNKSYLNLLLLHVNDLLKEDTDKITNDFYEQLASIYELLVLDAKAIEEGDPAAKSVEEVVRTYPGFYAICIYRIAHAICQLKVPFIPRILTEIAHSKTGIDIHPGAKIGSSFFIDHGTGVVIGETTVIGKNVKIYQGVTLGALSVSKEMAETKRHPTIEDHVVIYAGATILGGNTVIGINSIIGGNVWITKSVKENSMAYHNPQLKIREKNKMATLIDFIGNTPLVELNVVNSNPKVKIFGKLEGHNPGGSVKDRAAYGLIKGGIESGLIKKDSKLIEATSGNTGIALAMIARLMKIDIELVMPENSTRERVLTMRAYGAKVTLTSESGGMEASIDYARAKVKNHGYVMLDQFANPNNPKMHYETTGPEIFRDTDGKVTHFVSSMGTTGTIMGVSKYLKEQNNSIQIVGVQPEDGAKIPGIRKWPEEYLPKIFDRSRIDQIIEVNKEEAKSMAKRLASEEGVFGGMSSGGAVAAALKLSETIEEGNIVCIICDRGDKYLSTDLFE